ncbi:MAG TPA: sugar phosphate isomerase/epimerase [Acidothermaceae bacterium]|jgi:sugar phosphate isomerase/epimerase
MTDDGPLARSTPKIALSTSAVWPEPTAVAFEIAERLGYDGVELMVSGDPLSQDTDTIQRLVDYHQTPVLSVHSPCLLISQRVWGVEPWAKLMRSQIAAERLGAKVVVTHPPFRWQRSYARGFAKGIERMHDETDVVFAVENMFPQRGPGGVEISSYSPSWSLRDADYPHITLDISHAAVARVSALELMDAYGDRLAHVHLADGTGSRNDEHLVPGRGGQPCAQVLERLARDGYGGVVVLEVNTRRAATHDERVADLAESLSFAREALAVASA